MLKAPSVQALLAAVRLNAAKASHSKAFSAVSFQSNMREQGRFGVFLRLWALWGCVLVKQQWAAEGVPRSLRDKPACYKGHVLLRTGQWVSSLHLTAWLPEGSLDSVLLHFTSCACKSCGPDTVSQFFQISLCTFSRGIPAGCAAQRSSPANYMLNNCNVYRQKAWIKQPWKLT